MNQLKKYNHIISLGQNCEVAFQYTLSFGQIEAFPFNWAYVANVEKMLTALNKPELLFSGKIVYHSPSNMFFDEQSAVSFHGQRTPADLAKFSEQARAIEIEKEKEDTIGRVKHCFDKLFSVWASKESQLYIITFKEGSPVKINAYVQQLKHILASKTDNFTILVVLEQKHQGFPFTKESNIYYRFLKYYSPKDKVTTVELSDRSGWKKIFEEFQPQKILPKNKLYKFEKEQEPTIRNSCLFTNFDIKKERLSFDVIVTFKGIIPKTKQYVSYDKQVFPFEAEFSEPLEYDNLDVFQMVECYIKQAKLSDCFEDINIDLAKEGKPHDFSKGENYLFWNSYGLDSYSIYLTFRDELKERMIEFSWTTDKQSQYLEGMINRCAHYRTPVVICFKKMLESIDLLWNPCNSTYLGYLLYKKFNIKLCLYGDVAFSYFQPYNIKNIHQLNFAFYQTELISLYISMILGDNKMFNSMLFDNGDSKIIRKLAYSKILTDYLGLRFEDYIDQNRLDIFKEKIKYKTFDYYFQQEAAHPSMFVTNIYFFKDKFIKALVDLLYPSEKELVKQRFQKFFAEQKGGYPLYNGNYFTISYKAFKQYMDNLEGSLKELEKILYKQYKLLNLFDVHESPSYLCSNKDLKDLISHNTKVKNDEILLPAFSTNNIPVVLACDNNYAPYGAITINSIIQNASKDKNYDIILLHTDISDENQEKIQMLANGRKNISIRIIDVTPQLENIKKNLFVHNFYSIATYFRILIPQLCQLYKKVLYLDTDVIACRDVALLYDTDITSYLLAATPDAAAICQANLGKKMPDRDQTYRDYFQNTLGVGDINKYFQAGVLVLNIKLLRENDIYSQFMNKLKELPNPFYVDQDILNSICYGKVKLLESSWNHVTHIKSCNYFKGYIPETLFQQFVKARQNPKIIHFTGPEKPWHNPKWILGEYFWKYAFNTPFTETLFFSITAGYVQKYMNLDNWTIDWDTVIYTHFYEQKKRKYKFLKFLNKFLFWNRKKRKELMQLMEKRLKKATFLLNKFSGFYKSIPNGITDIQAIESSKLFDKQYYSQKYGVPQKEAITHYCRKGWKKGYNPNPVFHTREYMKLNACRTNPLLDYIYNGKKLGHYVCRSTEDQTSPEDIRIYWKANAENRKSRVVYTCLTGNYDSLINHKFVHPGWRYVCFTDNASLLKQGKAGVWEMKELAVRTDNNILNNRYHKILPYDLFPAEVEESLYVDSNCNILTSYIFDTVENRKSSLLVPIHFSTTCLYQEMDWYARHYPEQAENVARLRGKFLAEGFPENYGMNENNIIYRRHADVKVKEIMQLWWAMLKDFVPRDQLSFSYCLWKYGLSPEEIGISNARTDLKNFIFYPHQRGK